MNHTKPQRRALKHGALAVGRFPKGASYIARLVLGLRRELEKAVGPDRLTVPIQAAISRACQAEGERLLWCRWRRVEEKLSVDQRLEISRLILAATADRDRCIASLGLDETQLSAWDKLHAARHGGPQ